MAGRSHGSADGFATVGQGGNFGSGRGARRRRNMSLLAYLLLATSSLFVIVDPLAAVPAFIAMTPSNTPADRIRMARLAAFVMAGVLLGFCRTVDFPLSGHHHAGVRDRGKHRAPAGLAGHAAGAAFAGVGDARGNCGGHRKAGHCRHAAGHSHAFRSGRDFHRHRSGEPGAGPVPADRPVPEHRGGFGGDLHDPAPLGSRHAMAQPDRPEHRDPHHGSAAGGSRRAIHDQRHPGGAGGLNRTRGQKVKN